jgi:putative transposase
MRKTIFAPNNYYHILNRGTDERKIFLNTLDYQRFISYLVVFNDCNVPPRNISRLARNPKEIIDLYNPDKRSRLIDILAFTLMPNHFHLFVREKEEKGISKLMHRVCMGYSRYFNLKNERKGNLWQGAFAAKSIDEQSYFIHIMSYIHLNTLDGFNPEWRKGKINNWREAESKMRNYAWSSYGYYRTGKDESGIMRLILTQPDWFPEYFPTHKSFENNIHLWASRFSDGQ